MKYNQVGWFEIPVRDMDRASKFYEAVFGRTISLHEISGFQMGWFPGDHSSPGATGSLVKHDMYTPSDTAGVLIYFSCEDLSQELNKVDAAGGQIMQGKTEIGGGHGFMAIVRDSEGNRLGLHSTI